MVELRSLHYLVTLARRLHYTRAAEELGLTQSALTRSIQMLERQLGMRLFDRDRGAGVFLTPQGRLVVQQAEALLDDAEQFERNLQQTARGTKGRVRFGVAPMQARALLSQVLKSRLTAAPAVANEVVVRHAEALWPLLAAGDIEFFVSGEGQVPDNIPIREDHLGDFPLNLIVRNGHPLLTGENTADSFPVFKSARVGDARELLSGLGEQPPGVVHHIEDYSTLATLTRSTNAIWITSVFAAAQELKDGSLQELKRLNSAGTKSFRVIAYSFERRSLSPAALLMKKEFRRCIQDLKKSV